MIYTIKTVPLALLLLTLVFAESHAQQRARKALFIIADGIPPDVIEKVNTPHLDSIARIGNYLRAHVGGEKGGYSETPTISAVGYNSLLTGTWVNKHNVTGNDIKDPDYHYPTIFRLLKDEYPQKKIAVFSSWLDNRTKLVGDGLPQTRNIHVDEHADGYELDTINFKHDRQRDFMHRIDEKVTAEAVASIKTKAPDLSWVYLEYTDDIGHIYGDSPQYDSAVQMMDRQVGHIWDAIRYREQHFKEDWLIFITTDHGRDEQTGKGHGGQSERQRSTWMVTNYRPLNDYAKYYTPGIVDIMPSIARFMDIKIPETQLREIDGTPLIGPVSIAVPKLNFIEGTLDVSWKALDPQGKVKVFVASANNYKTGTADDYKLLAEVPVNQQHASINVKNMPSGFYKVCLEAPHNTVNKWLILPDKNSITNHSK